MDMKDAATQSVLATLAGSSVFITGGTGFVGKVLIEKLLRCVPDIRRLYILVRPRKGQSAAQRVHQEIIESAAFTRLRQQIGDVQFQALAKRKLCAVSGDLVQNRLGIDEASLKEIIENVSVIWHCAASIDFNMRLDLAIDQNVAGSLRVLDIARSCKSLRAFVHVSTAYVNCNRSGFVEEKLYPIHFDATELLDNVSKLSVRELQKISIDGGLRDWPNTYTFTKFMTEHLLVQRHGDIPLAIVRPAIIGASWREPLPGWIDVVSAVGALYMAIGFGVVDCMPGSLDNIGDVVPVDFVVNTMILAVPAVIEKPDRVLVCHAAGSVLRPWRWSHAKKVLPKWWDNHKPAQSLTKRTKFSMTSHQTLFELHMFLRYSMPSALLNAIAIVGTKKQKRMASQLERLVGKVRMLVDAFRYFTEHEWQFDASVTMSLLDNVPAKERDVFWLSLDPINFTQYHRNFLYGLLNYVLKEELVEIDPDLKDYKVCLNEPEADEDSFPRTSFSSITLLSSPKQWLSSLIAPDMSWAIEQLKQHPLLGSGPSIEAMRASVLSSATVQAAIQAAATSTNVSINQVQHDAIRMIEKLAGDQRAPIVAGMGALLRKVFRRLYENVLVDAASLQRVHAVVDSSSAPVIYLPTHRSYVDFLVVSFMCFIHRLPMPFIAAGEDFLGIALLRSIFRRSGAFFLRRSFNGDELYQTIFGEYFRQLLACGHSLEFFIEGTRSRSGKMLQPRLGLLSMLTRTMLQGDIEDATIVPIAISYEHTLEAGLYKEELLGESKIKESLRNLVRAASSVLASSFGRISVNLGEPISLREYAARLGLTSISDGRVLTQSLAHRVCFELSHLSEVMPTHMVAALLLLYRHGVSRSQLMTKVEWLRRQIVSRGGRVALVQTEKIENIVDNAIRHLREAIIERRHHVYEPKITSRPDYNNMLLLGHYRNQMAAIFFREGIWACALHSFGHDVVTEGADKDKIFEAAKFLYALLQREAVDKPHPSIDEDHEAGFQLMLDRGIFRVNDAGRVEVESEAMFSFLCSLCWPYVDSYYVTAMTLHMLQNDKPVSQNVLLQRAQWLGTTLYHESMLCFYESCSLDTLRNALSTFEQFGVITRSRNVSEPSKKAKNKKKSAAATNGFLVGLSPDFHDGNRLQDLIHRIDDLRKRPAVVKSSLRRAMIAEIPALAKL